VDGGSSSDGEEGKKVHISDEKEGMGGWEKSSWMKREEGIYIFGKFRAGCDKRSRRS